MLKIVRVIDIRIDNSNRDNKNIFRRLEIL